MDGAIKIETNRGDAVAGSIETGNTETGGAEKQKRNERVGRTTNRCEEKGNM